MSLHPVQMCPHRVHMSNIRYDSPKHYLLELVSEWCGLPDAQMQVIRKRSGHTHGLCSAIFAVPTHDDIQRCVTLLNSIPPDHLQHILGPGAWGLEACEANPPGARRVTAFGRSDAANTPTPPPPPPPPPPPYDSHVQHTQLTLHQLANESNPMISTI